VDARILLVEDDPSIREVTALGLTAAGFGVTAAADGAEGLERWRADRPDLVLLDVMLPRLDGLEVLRAIRREATTPVLMLTARADTIDVVVGLESGADDYVRKPFGLAELRSRIRAVLRRSHGRTVEDEDGAIVAGNVSLDPFSRDVTVGGRPVRLTFSEFELLHCLMSRPGRLFNRQELLRAIWGDSAYRDPRAIDVHIRHLREKLEEEPADPQLILTVRGAGYRFSEP
jgi:DNA-binding response OmpR family regulator